jgi:hypothetical protein
VVPSEQACPQHPAIDNATDALLRVARKGWRMDLTPALPSNSAFFLLELCCEVERLRLVATTAGSHRAAWRLAQAHDAFLGELCDITDAPAVMLAVIGLRRSAR